MYEKKLFSALVFIVLLSLIFPLFTQAISISPPIMEINLDPGESASRTIKVSNETALDKVYYVNTERFVSKGEEGLQQFIPPEDKEDGVIEWIHFESDFLLVPSKGEKEFNFTVDAPLGAEPGGHYAAILFGSTPPPTEEEGAAVGISGRIASLLLVKVSGDVREEANLESFHLKGDKTIVSHLPVIFETRIKNTGTVHIRPQGNIEVKDISGKRAELLDANPKNGRILPQSIRKLESQWGEGEISQGGFFKEVQSEFRNFAFGKYSAKLDVVYGAANGNLISSEISFWIIPWRILVLTVAIIIILIVIGRVGIKRYNRWIIKKSKK